MFCVVFFSFYFLFVVFRMRSERDFELILFRFRFHSRKVLKPGGGEKSSERKAVFSPPPGPPPLFWPRLSCKKMPAAFSTNWAVSREKRMCVGDEFLLVNKKLRPIQNLVFAKKPNTNQMPSGICTSKRRWGSKGLGPRGRGRGWIGYNN